MALPVRLRFHGPIVGVFVAGMIAGILLRDRPPNGLPIAARSAAALSEAVAEPAAAGDGANEAIAAGDACWEAGDLSGAARHYDQALRTSPNQPRILVRMATMLKADRRIGEAIALYRHALSLNPHQPAVANSLAWLLATCSDSRLRDPAAAIELAEPLRHSTGRAEPAHLDTLAAAYAADGQFDRAVATLRETLAGLDHTAPSPDFRWALVRRLEQFDRGRPYIEAPGAEVPGIQGFARVSQSFETALSGYIEDRACVPAGRAALMQIAWWLAGNSDAAARDGGLAVRIAKAVCRFEPRPEYVEGLAAALAETGQWSEAENMLARFLHDAADAASAQRLRSAQKQIQSRQPWRQTSPWTLPEAPCPRFSAWRRVAHAHQLAASDYLAAGATAPAEALLRAALRFDPTYLPAHRLLADLLPQRRQFDEAAALLTQAMLLKSDQADVLVRLGTVRKLQGRLRDAAGMYRAALELHPQRWDVVNSLAWLLATAEDEALFSPQEAVTLAGAACAATEFTQVEYLDTLAAAQASNGEFEQALRTVEKILSLLDAQADGDGPLDAAQRDRFALRAELYRNGRALRGGGAEWLLLARAFAELDQPQTAGRLYRRALSGHSKTDGPILLELGGVLQRCGQREEACRVYRQILADDPSAWPAAVALAEVLLSGADREDLDEAVRLAGEACSATHYSRPQAIDTLLRAYAARGDDELALALSAFARERAERVGDGAWADRFGQWEARLQGE